VNLPLVALTTGDPCGIGPEISVKVAALPEFADRHRAFAIGDKGRLEQEIRRNRLALRLIEIRDVSEVMPQPGVLHVLPGPPLPADLPYGQVDARAGFAAFTYVQQAIKLANAAHIDAICTAPLNKEALSAAGIPYPGHTEMLAELSGTQNVAMLLISTTLTVALVTIHCSLAEAIRQISVGEELRVIRLADTTLRRMGIGRPRVAVAGLNPHAGEGGLFGSEDREILSVAVQAARLEGIDATGPHPPDTVFMQARKGNYDIVVAQYHDQGLIPVKLLGIEHGVNLTAGLPYVRTSPDHGTAFDIAGRGLADPVSLKTALEMARDLCRKT
jgi:4-hydroxythreonine-4-phosphate dehydrogenase